MSCPPPPPLLIIMKLFRKGGCLRSGCHSKLAVRLWIVTDQGSPPESIAAGERYGDSVIYKKQPRRDANVQQALGSNRCMCRDTVLWIACPLQSLV